MGTLIYKYLVYVGSPQSEHTINIYHNAHIAASNGQYAAYIYMFRFKET